MSGLADIQSSVDRTAAAVAGAPAEQRAQWVIYLLESLESNAMNDPDHPEPFEAMLEKVKDAIADRLAARRWP